MWCRRTSSREASSSPVSAPTSSPAPPSARRVRSAAADTSAAAALAAALSLRSPNVNFLVKLGKLGIHLPDCRARRIFHIARHIRIPFNSQERQGSKYVSTTRRAIPVARSPGGQCIGRRVIGAVPFNARDERPKRAGALQISHGEQISHGPTRRRQLV